MWESRAWAWICRVIYRPHLRFEKWLWSDRGRVWTWLRRHLHALIVDAELPSLWKYIKNRELMDALPWVESRGPYTDAERYVDSDGRTVIIGHPVMVDAWKNANLQRTW